MRQVGNSGKVATISGIVAAGLLVLTGMTLAEPVFIAFLGVLAFACLAALMEVFHRRRYVLLAVTGLATALAVAGALAFLSTWELAFAGQVSIFRTPLPTGDPDDYFVLAVLSLLTALGALFAGAVWPGKQHGAKRSPLERGAKQGGRQATARQGGRQAAVRRAASKRPVRRPTA